MTSSNVRHVYRRSQASTGSDSGRNASRMDDKISDFNFSYCSKLNPQRASTLDRLVLVSRRAQLLQDQAKTLSVVFYEPNGDGQEALAGTNG